VDITSFTPRIALTAKPATQTMTSPLLSNATLPDTFSYSSSPLKESRFGTKCYAAIEHTKRQAALGATQQQDGQGDEATFDIPEITTEQDLLTALKKAFKAANVNGDGRGGNEATEIRARLVETLLRGPNGDKVETLMKDNLVDQAVDGNRRGTSPGAGARVKKNLQERKVIPEGPRKGWKLLPTTATGTSGDTSPASNDTAADKSSKAKPIKDSSSNSGRRSSRPEGGALDRKPKKTYGEWS
jgi:hypothetical protein